MLLVKLEAERCSRKEQKNKEKEGERQKDYKGETESLPEK